MRKPLLTLLIAGVALAGTSCGGGSSEPEPTAMAAILKNKFVRIGTHPVNIPFEFGKGTDVQGYDVDLGIEICKDIGFDAKWVKLEFDKLLESLKNRELEMVISTVAITEERKREFAFSEPYYDSGNTIARRRESQEITDLASLAGKTVGVQSGRTGDLFMSSQKVAANVTLHRFSSLDEALGALNRREIEAVVGDEPIITYSIASSFANLMTTGVKLTQNQYAVALRPEERELLEKVNGTIRRLKSANAFQGMYDKWIGEVLKTAGEDRAKVFQEEKLKEAPKSVSVKFIKGKGSDRDFTKFEGFTVTLAGPAGTFQSTPIRCDDAAVTGDSKFNTSIPPGEYKLSLPRIGLKDVPVDIKKEPKTSMTITVTFGPGLSTQVEVK